MKAVWMEYKLACEASGVRAAGLCSFRQHWRKLLPQIKVMKPMSDLCWECQQNSVAMMRAANLHISEKSDVKEQQQQQQKKINNNLHCFQVVKKAEAHLELATKARSFYRAQIEESKRMLKGTFGSSLPPLNSGIPSNTKLLTIHLSFDVAQQVGAAIKQT